MNAIKTIELKDLDPDDISDVLVKIEKSFGLTLRTDTFKNARTFGELCDNISSKIDLENADYHNLLPISKLVWKGIPGQNPWGCRYPGGKGKLYKIA